MTREFQYPEDVPVLVGDEVVLRAITEADLPAVVEQARDPLMVDWTQVPSPYLDQDAEWFLGVVHSAAVDGSQLTWALDVDGSYAGNISLRHQPFGGAELGFATHPRFRGRGLMKAAVLLVADYAFTRGGVQVLSWTAGFGNWASRRVAWACGFQFEGVRHLGWSNGRRRADEWTGTLLAGDDRVPRTRWLRPPTIRGDRVVLREQRDDDSERIAAGCSDELTKYWLGALPEPYDQAEAHRFIDLTRDHHSRGAWMTWALADPVNDIHLGVLSLMSSGLVPGGQAEIGYWLHPDARGRGVMAEAVQLAVGHAFDKPENDGLGLGRLGLRVAELNTTSRQVAQSNGFVLVGRERKAEHLRNGEIVDLFAFDLLPSDPR